MFVGLGQAYEMRFLRDGATMEEMVRFSPDWWWAWSGTPKRGDLRLVRVLGGRIARQSDSQGIMRHIKFHGEAPNRMLAIIDAEDKAPLRRVGIITAIAYDARGVSRLKGDRPYRHYFGDTGEGITSWDPDNAPCCPALCYDADNRLIVKRRVGNDYSLGEWVVG